MNEVYIALDHVLTYGNYSDFLPHKHMAQHILIGIDDKIQCIIENETIFCDGIFIDGMKMHTIVNSGSSMLVLMIDDGTHLSKQMKLKYPSGQGHYLLSSDVVNRIRAIWRENMPDRSNINFVIANYSNTFDLIIQACNIERNSLKVIDYRINTTMEIIRNKPSIENNIVEQLANEVFLSTSRLSHLFKQETGITLKNYLVLMKIRKTYSYIVNGLSLSDACIQAGFSSLSHFVATNKRWFGMSIKQQQKNFSRFVEIK